MFDRLDCDVEGSSVTFSLLYLGVALAELIKNHKKSSGRIHDICAGYFYIYSLLPYYTPLGICAYTEH